MSELFDPKESTTNLNLAQIVKTRSAISWERFPFVLFCLNEQGIFDYELVVSIFDDEEDHANFIKLLLFSIALYRFLDNETDWSRNLYKRILSDNDRFDEEVFGSAIKMLISHLKEDTDFDISKITLNSVRIKKQSENIKKSISKAEPKAEYKEPSKFHDKEISPHIKSADSKNKGRHKATQKGKGRIYSREYLLSQIFSSKQKELFLKRLNGEPFSKTDREYFSRCVMKKVLTLADDNIHCMAKKILTYTKKSSKR